MFVEQKSDLTMNIFTRTITDKNGNHLYLTSKEFDLFYFLYSYRGQVFTKEQLYENVLNVNENIMFQKNFLVFSESYAN